MILNGREGRRRRTTKAVKYEILLLRKQNENALFKDPPNALES